MRLAWDDLQTVEAVVRAGTVLAAARELGLRHSSVLRRLDALERDLGAPLFLRGRRLRPTPLGEALAERAGRMRAPAGEAEALVEAQRRVRAGRLVVTTNDVLATLLLRALASTGLGARVELRVSEAELPLEPGVTDLALRPGATPGPALRGQRLGRLRLGVFRARAAGGAGGWVQPSDGLRRRASMPWWKAVPREAPARVECDTLLAVREACLAGLGRAVLPALLAEGDPRLALEAPVPGGPPVWLLAAPTRAADAGLTRALRDLASALRRVPGAWEAGVRA